MKVPAFIDDFTAKVQQVIIELENDKEKLTGEQKKEKLDAIILTWVLNALEALQVNIVVKLILKSLITKNLSKITQKIFDLIQVKVAGITKSKNVA